MKRGGGKGGEGGGEEGGGLGGGVTKRKGESEQEEGNRNSIHVIKAEKVNKEKHTHSHELLFIVFSS